MKKFFTLRNIVLFAGALLILMAFFFTFGAKLTITQDGYSGSYNNIVWGCKDVTTEGARVTIYELMGVNRIQPAVLPCIGAFLMLVGAIGAVVAGLLLKNKVGLIVVIACAVVALAGGVFQFFAYTAFLRAMIMTEFKANNYKPTAEEIKEAFQNIKAGVDSLNPRIGMSIASGIIGILGALAACASRFLPEKK